MLNREFWFRQSTKDKVGLANAVVGTIQSIRKNQAYRDEDILRCMRLYRGVETAGLGVAGYSRVAGEGEKISMNAISACVDTDTAQITANQVKPTPVTNDGDYLRYRQAKTLELFGQGAFYETSYQEKAEEGWRNAAIFGTGALKAVGDLETSKLDFEVTFIGELCVDDADAINGRPRCLYQTKIVSRDWALCVWPKHKTAIEEAPGVTDDNAAMEWLHANHTDMIEVHEAWCLPTRKDAKDGRHWIGISGATFHISEWKRPRFPFVFFRWKKPTRGFWGTGVCHEIDTIQDEINEVAERIQEANRLLGAPWVWVEESSNVNVDALDNTIGGVHTFSGQKPTVEVHATQHPETYQQLDRLWNKAFEIPGISQSAATARKPAGLDSGAAQREYNDTVSGRYFNRSKEWERGAMTAFLLLVDEAKEIVAKHGEFKMMATGRRFGRRFAIEIDFAKIDLEDDAYVLQVFPTSTLSIHPAGRRQELQDRIQMGLITPEDAQEQMDLPDSERSRSLALAAIHDIDETVYRFFYLDPEEDEEIDVLYEPPEPFQDLAMGIKRVQSEYLRAKRSGVPQERLELARRWMADAKAMIDDANKAMMPPAAQSDAMAMPGAPMPQQLPPPMPVA